MRDGAHEALWRLLRLWLLYRRRGLLLWGGHRRCSLPHKCWRVWRWLEGATNLIYVEERRNMAAQQAQALYRLQGRGGHSGW